jgi:peroxiredoxin
MQDPASVFYETEWTFRKDIIKLNSFLHYKELKAKDTQAMFGVSVDEIFVTEKFNKGLDIFTFIPFTTNKFITSRLKNTLEQHKVTGLVYDDAPEINF